MVTLLFAAIAVVVLAPMLLTLVACRSMLYHPTNDVVAGVPGWTAARVRVDPEVELLGLVRGASSSSSAVLLFGGNGSSISGNRGLLELIDSTGTSSVAVFAYRGYDGSGGQPEEELLKSDAVAILEYLEKHHGFEVSKLVLIGQSLGSGLASYLAAKLSKEGRPPKALVLLSPYTSIARVFDDQLPLIPIGWAVSDRWDTAAIAKDVACPVLIVHGVEDTLISIEHGRKLASLFGSRATLVEIAGAGHNDVFRDPRSAEAIRGVLR